MTWADSGDQLRRTVTCASFHAAIDLVNAVARIAEQLNHHPDIDVRFKEVTFTCWTHTAGGVTDKDRELAARIDALIDA